MTEYKKPADVVWKFDHRLDIIDLKLKAERQADFNLKSGKQQGMALAILTVDSFKQQHPEMLSELETLKSLLVSEWSRL